MFLEHFNNILTICLPISGLYAVAYDDKVEWVIVKGVASFGDPTQPSSGDWKAFASTMAASVVANILNDPHVFQGWPHYSQGKCPHWKSWLRDMIN